MADWSDPPLTEVVAQTVTTSGHRLLPGETAQITMKNVTLSPADRVLFRIFAFTTSGELDDIPKGQVRLRGSSNLQDSFSMRDVYGFAVKVTNDETSPTQTVSGQVEIRFDQVNLTSGLAAP